MEEAGLVFAVVGEVRTLANSIVRRIARFTAAPGRFTDVGSSVTRLMLVVDEIEEVGKRNESSFPIEMVRLFDKLLSSVRDNLVNMARKLDDYSKKTVSTAYGFFRANCCFEKITAIEQNAKEAEAKVLHMLGLLMSISVGQKMENSFRSVANLSNISAFLSASVVTPTVSPVLDPVDHILYECEKRGRSGLMDRGVSSRKSGSQLIAAAIAGGSGSEELVDLIGECPLPPSTFVLPSWLRGRLFSCLRGGVERGPLRELVNLVMNEVRTVSAARGKEVLSYRQNLRAQFGKTLSEDQRNFLAASSVEEVSQMRYYAPVPLWLGFREGLGPVAHLHGLNWERICPDDSFSSDTGMCVQDKKLLFDFAKYGISQVHGWCSDWEAARAQQMPKKSRNKVW